MRVNRINPGDETPLIRPAPGPVWVFHNGALGDSVLLWPMLRALRAGGATVTLVAPGSRARLAAAELGIRPLDLEQPRFSSMWNPGFVPSPIDGVSRVATFIADAGSAGGRAWLDAATAMFPGALIEPLPAPIDRPAALRLGGAAGAAPARRSGEGPMVFHLGAGSRVKMWPVERWERLWQALGAAPRVIAGEAEAERFNAAERVAMDRMGGVFLSDLDGLAAILRSARLFVGCDTGPTHLAAQLGIPTLALFGPTDPERWGPIGPAVGVLAPANPRGMSWLDARTALAALDSMERGDQ